MRRLALLLLFIFTSSANAAGIAWEEWGSSAFLRAKQEDKLILIDVGMEGCTACRRMDEITYTDPTVIQLIREHFVTIAVDSESRPDIGERYSDWAWPATIFLDPDTTQVLALRGNRVPRNFIPILRELIAKQASGQLTADKLAPYGAPPEPASTELTDIRDRVRAQLDRSLNETNGGWSSRGIRTSAGAPLRHLFLRAHLSDDARLQDIALKTTDGYRRALDPVWGGVFVLVLSQGDVIPEKRISNQANAMMAFADAFQLTGDAIYLESIDLVDRYLKNWMRSSDGTFFTSQEDVAPGLPNTMGARGYYALTSDEARRRYGIPPIDHAIYTDKNGEIIAAYARAYEATGKEQYLDIARRAADFLLAERLQTEGWMLQTATSKVAAGDKRMRPLATESRPFLSAQASFGSALLALYRITGEPKWLDHARTVAEAMVENLQDKDLGGFYSTTPDETADLIAPRKPLEQNAMAANLLYDLFVYDKINDGAAIPEKTLRAVALPSVIRREGKITGQTALALEKLTAKYVEFTVVGSAIDDAAQALFAAGRETYEPRKLLHFEKPGRYPARDVAAMYICNPDACSLPIEEPEKVARFARLFRGPAQ